MTREQIVAGQLSAMSVLAGAHVAEIKELAVHAVRHERKWNTGKRVLLKSDEYSGLICLMEGELEVSLLSPTGKELLLHRITAPRAVALPFTMVQHQIPVQIRCVRDCRASLISKQVFYRLLQSNTSVLDAVFSELAANIEKLTGTLVFLQFKTIRSKLLAYLGVQRRQHNSLEIRLTHTQSELAQMFGVERPSVAAVLGDLVREGVLERQGRRCLRILKPDVVM